MSLASIIRKAVKTSFNKIGDLGVRVTLVQRNATGFNFSTGSVVSTTQVTTETLGVLKQSTKKDSSVVTTLVVPSDGISEPDIYDRVIINSITWNIIPPYKDNGYTIELSLTKESV